MKCSLYRYGEEIKAVWLKFDPPEAKIGATERTGKEKLKNNLCRAKSRITELALCNDWEYFVTLTVDGAKHERENLDSIVKDLGAWVQRFNRKYCCKMRYVLIPEQHKDGKSWHMHGLFGGVPAAALVVNEHGYLDIPYYRSTFGYISMSRIRNKARCARYITKYVTKSIDHSSARLGDMGKHLYYASKGLSGKVSLGEFDIDIPRDAYAADYCYIKWLAAGEALIDINGEVIEPAVLSDEVITHDIDPQISKQ
jgi:hypothetical protein